jgi:CheY-like chemotaxis protein
MIDLLIIDDDEVLRMLMSRWAASAGYAVAEAASVAEALALIGAVRPAVALSDVRLPDGDGRALSQLLGRQSPQTALILMSGLGAGASLSCFDSGAIGFLAKPFSRAQLLAAIALGVNAHLDRAAAAMWERAACSPRVSYDGVRVVTPPMP